ncbi:hypothetical protein AMJ57_03400 [Parcubacteria bacterium SG8_24]|nr:MAG: hypothetical protein AMJ57_03400 [Parcubacteria bacterium SG8_24]
MTHNETCYCKKRELVFRSDFGVDTVTQLYCPDCVDRSPEDAIIFEMCEPNEYHGVWGVLYNRTMLKELDDHFRDNDDYYLSLLISGTVGPEIARKYGEAGLCRIIGFKYGPDRSWSEAAIFGTDQKLADEGQPTDWPGDVVAGPKEARRGKPGKT